jgi:serine/threonine-protein kinase RsbW
VRESLHFPSDPSELRRLIDFAAGFAHRNAFSDGERARLSIILEELFTNAVNHGFDRDAGLGRIEVALVFDDGRLEIEFSDDGRLFDPLGRPLPDLGGLEGDRRIGGLGLHIVRALVDEARHFRSGGRNHLVLTRVITREPDPPSASA